MNKNFKNIIAYSLISLAFLSGCKEDDLVPTTTLHTDRAFSATGLTATVANKVNVILSWNKVANASSYVIEIYDNTTFTGTPVKTISNVNFAQLPYTVTGLAGNLQHAVRVKSISSDGAEDSKWITATFKTEAEQIFQDIASGKLTPNSVTLNWLASETVTNITLSPGGISRALTPAEKTAGEVTFTGLTPRTAYTATILNGSIVRGTKLFTTLTDLPTGSDVVYVNATDDLGAMIQAATANKRFVVLQGSKYNSDAPVVLPAGLDISIIGEAGPVKPIISLSLFTLPASGGKLHFENVELSAYANGDKTTTRRPYIINQSAASNMGQVSFENCKISDFLNTPLRIQTATTTIDRVIVNNCVVDNIGIADAGPGTGTYAFINVTGTGKINNITITNSTFSNIGYSLILHNVTPSLSVTVDNNTFYNVIGDTRYLIDYNAQTVANGFTFRNNILGKTLSPAGTARGIRGGTVPTVTNNYQTSDAAISANAIPSITAYSGTSTSLFTAPATANFKIKDDTFAGKASAGDPRWRL
jgi:hypothetical protein